MGIAPVSVDVSSLAAILDEQRVRVVELPGKGRGVVAARFFARGERIEQAPVIIVEAPHVAAVEISILDNYVYNWDRERIAVALGCGSLYNHSYQPNAVYLKNFASGVIDYVALCDIQPGQEILINYNGDPSCQTRVWFDVIEPT